MLVSAIKIYHVRIFTAWIEETYVSGTAVKISSSSRWSSSSDLVLARSSSDCLGSHEETRRWLRARATFALFKMTSDSLLDSDILRDSVCFRLRSKKLKSGNKFVISVILKAVRDLVFSIFQCVEHLPLVATYTYHWFLKMIIGKQKTLCSCAPGTLANELSNVEWSD